MKCRLIEPVGKRYDVTWMVQGESNHWHVHREGTTKEVWDSGDGSKFDEFERDVTCDQCGHSFHARPTSFSTPTVWNTEDGKPHPGDMYWAPWWHQDGRCLAGWENCNDPRGHLIVILPNGNTWDVDSRASNCTMKEDKTHRCWIRTGEPPDITAGKDGHTCSAGAGSILSGDYHGFLRNGELTNC